MRNFNRGVSPRRRRDTIRGTGQIKGIIRPVWLELRYIGLRFIVAAIDSTTRLMSGILRLTRPLFITLLVLVQKLTLASVLQGYFLILKFKRKVNSLVSSGTMKILNALNEYVFKITIAGIVLLAVAVNMSTRSLNAEELQSSFILDSIVGAGNPSQELIIEGPLDRALKGSSIGSDPGFDSALLDDYIMAPYAPDTDDDNIYATVDGEGAIIAPIITDPGATTPSVRNSAITYVVEPGDTLGTIAQRFEVSINTLLWHNSLTFYSTIRPGQQLTILPTSGVEHAVKSGETLGSIAKKYQADIAEIVSFNKLADAGDIRIGEKLIIPDGIKPTAVALAPRTPKNIADTIKDIFAPTAPDLDLGSKLLWPLGNKRITQGYHGRHFGIDIGSKKGMPIFAAEAGRVERAGWNRGYGYNVIINHGNGLKTLYAHSSRLLVSAGDTVARGDAIALVGSTGWSTGPHLHFEVIANGRKLNPLNFTR